MESPQSLDGPVKVLPIAAEVSPEVVQSFFKAKYVGEQGFQDFILRFVASDGKSGNQISIFKPLKSFEIVTGLEKKKKGSKNAAAVFEKDRQAFGELVAEHISLNTALSYPLTRYPMSFATVEGSLRTGT